MLRHREVEHLLPIIDDAKIHTSKESFPKKKVLACVLLFLLGTTAVRTLLLARNAENVSGIEAVEKRDRHHRVSHSSRANSHSNSKRKQESGSKATRKQRSSSHTSTRVKAKPPADISDADPMQQIGSFVNIESKRNRNKKRSKKKTEEVELQQQPVFQQDYSGAFIWSETEVPMNDSKVHKGTTTEEDPDVELVQSDLSQDLLINLESDNDNVDGDVDIDIDIDIDSDDSDDSEVVDQIVNDDEVLNGSSNASPVELPVQVQSDSGNITEINLQSIQRVNDQSRTEHSSVEEFGCKAGAELCLFKDPEEDPDEDADEDEHVEEDGEEESKQLAESSSILQSAPTETIQEYKAKPESNPLLANIESLNTEDDTENVQEEDDEQLFHLTDTSYKPEKQPLPPKKKSSHGKH